MMTMKAVQMISSSHNAHACGINIHRTRCGPLQTLHHIEIQAHCSNLPLSRSPRLDALQLPVFAGRMVGKHVSCDPLLASQRGTI